MRSQNPRFYRRFVETRLPDLAIRVGEDGGSNPPAPIFRLRGEPSTLAILRGLFWLRWAGMFVHALLLGLRASLPSEFFALSPDVAHEALTTCRSSASRAATDAPSAAACRGCVVCSVARRRRVSALDGLLDRASRGVDRIPCAAELFYADVGGLPWAAVATVGVERVTGVGDLMAAGRGQKRSLDA